MRTPSLRLPRSIVYALYRRVFAVVEACEEFRSDEEVLRQFRLAGTLDDLFEDHAFIMWIHTLIDFIHQSEGRIRARLKGNQIEHGRHRALPTALQVRIELLNWRVLAKRDFDLDSPQVVIALIHSETNAALAIDIRHVLAESPRQVGYQGLQARQPLAPHFIHVLLLRDLSILHVFHLLFKRSQETLAGLILRQYFRIADENRRDAHLCLSNLSLQLRYRGGELCKFLCKSLSQRVTVTVIYL